jgi:hypothetical protein
MKFKLPSMTLLPATAGVLLLLLSPGTVSAQNNPNPGPTTNPFMPVTQDPWIAPDWSDADLVLTNIAYDGLPAGEVARDLRTQFKDKVDILVSPGPQNASGDSLNLDPANEIVKLQLKNVHPSELFRAMNLLFESENSPVRWRLMVNGNRRLVLLQVVPDLLSQAEHHADPRKVSVYYVGDLIGDGGMTLNQVVDTLEDVNRQGYGGTISIGFHNETQLVIVKGTPEQVALISNTLGALKENSEYTRYKASRQHLPAPVTAPPGNSKP